MTPGIEIAALYVEKGGGFPKPKLTMNQITGA